LEKEGVKNKILKAAVNVFAEKGFKAATTRDICGRAGANINAVSYYFGGKKKLYKAVLEYMFEVATKFLPDDNQIQSAEHDPEELLRLYIHTFTKVILSIEDDLDARLAVLFGKEVANPSPFLDEMVEKRITPGEQSLHGILRRILGPEIPQGVIRDCACGITGQVYYYAFAWPLFIRIYPDQSDMNRKVDHLATHIFRFSLGGLYEVKKAHQNNQFEEEGRSPR